MNILSFGIMGSIEHLILFLFETVALSKVFHLNYLGILAKQQIISTLLSYKCKHALKKGFLFFIVIILFQKQGGLRACIDIYEHYFIWLYGQHRTYNIVSVWKCCIIQGFSFKLPCYPGLRVDDFTIAPSQV